MLSQPIELTEEGDGGGEGPSDAKNLDAAPTSDDSDGEASASSTESVKNQSSLGQFDAGEGEGEGEGFKTPDRKIPPVTDCPPAPKKARPSYPIGNRRASCPRRCRIFLPDVSTSQLETMFPPAQVKREDGDDDASSRKSKRAREEDDPDKLL